MLSPVIWRPMDCFFIPVICFRKNTGMGHLSLFMDRGTEHPKNKKDISWFSSPLKMASPMATGKYLQIILRVLMISVPLHRLSTDPADLHKDLMARFMFLMMSKGPFTKLLMMANNPCRNLQAYNTENT